MGLPIWRDPDEQKSARSPPKPDPTASLRSSIRRRPSVHSRRQTRTRLPRDPTLLPPRLERSPPPLGDHGMRDGRRGQERGVPPISNLLEAADRNVNGPPPPPVPESRNYYADLAATRREGLTSTMQEDIRQSMAAERRRIDLADPTGPDFILPASYHSSSIDAPGDVEDPRSSSFDHRMERLRRLAEARHEARENERRDPSSSLLVREAEARGIDNDLRAMFRRESSTPDNAVIIHPAQPLRIIRSPEPMLNRSRPDSRSGNRARRSNLPTPPLDTSGPEDRILMEDDDSVPARANRPSHPLSNSWRADSPGEVDGLGDRNRSPTPGDAWEIMRSTITPDETLPSAESSFTSSAASQSFNASSNNTSAGETDASSTETRRHSSRRHGERADSVSSVGSADPDDLICNEEDEFSTEAFVEDIYFYEMESPEGRARIAAHQRLRQEEGNRFAEPSQPGRIDIGLRLLEEAFNSEEGSERLANIRNSSEFTVRNYSEMLAEGRRMRERRRRALHEADRVPSPHPERYGEATANVASETRRQVHDYFRRFGADSLQPRSSSPPPQYEPLSSHPNATTFTSRDGPTAQPVSPHQPLSEREDSEALLSGGDAQDLDSMRRIVERLAARDDVPEEWWTSIGLNLSRTRPRNRSPAGRHRQRSASPRSATTRIENMWNGNRGNSRL